MSEAAHTLNASYTSDSSGELQEYRNKYRNLNDEYRTIIQFKRNGELEIPHWMSVIAVKTIQHAFSRNSNHLHTNCPSVSFGGPSNNEGNSNIDTLNMQNLGINPNGGPPANFNLPISLVAAALNQAGWGFLGGPGNSGPNNWQGGPPQGNQDFISPASSLSIKLDGTVQLASNWFQEQLWNLDTVLDSSSQHENATQVLREVEAKTKTDRRSDSDDDDDYSSSNDDDDSNDGYFVRSTVTTTKRRDAQPKIPPTRPTITYYKEVKTTKRDVNARADYDVDSDSGKHDSDDSDENTSSDSEDSYENKVAVTVPIIIETTKKRGKKTEKLQKEFFGALRHWVHKKIGKKKGHKVQRIQSNDGSSEYKPAPEVSFNPGLIPPLLESLKNKTEEEAIETFNALVEKYTNNTKKLHEIQEFLDKVKNKTEEEAHNIVDKINSTAQGLIEHVKNDTESQAQNLISEMNHTAQEWIEHAKNETQDAAENTYNQFINQSQQMIQEAINKTEKQIEELKNQTELHIQELKNLTESQIEKLKNQTGSQIEELKNKTVDEVDKIKNLTETITDKLEELKPPQDLIEDVKNETLHIVEEHLTTPNLSFIGLSPSYKIGQDSMIKAFTNEILDRTLQLFDDVMKRSSEYHWKNRIKELARGYRTKFKEFLSSTKKHTIRTKYGPKKVISNAIDVSNRIIHRLMEYASHEMEKKGLIYNNMTPKMLQTALFKEKKHILKQACKKFGVCNNQVNPFLNFIVDVTTAMLSVPNNKFETAFRSLTAAIKETDFFLGYNTNIGIKRKIKFVERQNVNVQKGIVMILKNIFANRNMPIAVSSRDDLVESKLRSTLALHEIINIFDDETQDYGGYKQERDEIRRHLEAWVHGSNVNIDPTMSRFVTHIQNVISNLDHMSRNVIINSAKLLFS